MPVDIAPAQDARVPQDPFGEARSCIANIFAALKIERVIYVDDLFERDSRQLDVVLGYLALTRDLGAAEALIPGVPFHLDREIWELRVRAWWAAADDVQRDDVTRRAGQLVDREAEALDHVARSALRRILPVGVEVDEISPNAWLGREQELNLATKEARILCLFDRELGEFEVGGRRLDGVDLLVEAVQDERNQEVLFGLFSHGFTQGGERAEWQEIAKEHGLNQDRFLPISKRRQANARELASGLEMMVLNMFCDRMKRATVRLLHSAHTEAAKAFAALDVYEFDSMVLRAAQEEGTWEPEFLVRIYQIFHRDETRKLISDDAAAIPLNEYVRTARAVNANRPEVPPAEPAERWKVRHRELFEAGEIVNQFHAPLRTGDIFEGSGHRLYVLLAQPCDVAVRTKTGERKNFVVPLVQLTKMGAAEFMAYRNERVQAGEDEFMLTRALLHYIDPNANDVGMVEFKSGFPIQTEVLDLAVLNREGECSINVSEPYAHPHQFSEAWRKRADLVVQRFASLAESLDEYKVALEAVKGPSRAKLWAAVMPRTAPPQLKIAAQPYRGNGLFDFSLRRVAHLREPSSTRLLASYTRFLSRDAEEYDIGRV